LPEGYDFIADDAIYTYYFHEGKPDNKIVLLLQGPDHNGALKSNFADLFFTKGYNVLAMDTRSLKAVAYLKIHPHPSLESFLAAHHIPLSRCLDMIFINAHGAINSHHTIATFEVHHLKVTKSRPITSEWIAEILSSFSIQHPVKIAITSCYGWAAVEGALKVLPYGSEIVAFS
jgi:hypothetical protein